MRRSACFCCYWIAFATVFHPSYAHHEKSNQAQDPKHSVIDCRDVHSTSSDDFWETIRRFVLPSYLDNMYRLRSYIASDEFSRSSDSLSTAQRVDAIYLKAVMLTDGNVMEALFLCAVATLPYKTFPAVIPLVNFVITVPVSTESEGQFRRRLKNLPSGLFLDSHARGDQDKLTHFFGSAYLVCVLKAPLWTMSIGSCVEMLESIFKLEGSRDLRDEVANERGIAFGTELMQLRDVLPSKFLHVSLSK